MKHVKGLIGSALAMVGFPIPAMQTGKTSSTSVS